MRGTRCGVVVVEGRRQGGDRDEDETDSDDEKGNAFGEEAGNREELRKETA